MEPRPSKVTPSGPKAQKATKATVAVPSSSKAQNADKSPSRGTSPARKKTKVLTDDEMLAHLRKIALEGTKCK
ncbi:hypothetical protein N7490_006898 [Penicillium lividum]|nr:hypothetical protein N7490_006898 [Penicillium lividum]